MNEGVCGVVDDGFDILGLLGAVDPEAPEQLKRAVARGKDNDNNKDHADQRNNYGSQRVEVFLTPLFGAGLLGTVGGYAKRVIVDRLENFRQVCIFGLSEQVVISTVSQSLFNPFNHARTDVFFEFRQVKIVSLRLERPAHHRQSKRVEFFGFLKELLRRDGEPCLIDRCEHLLINEEELFDKAGAVFRNAKYRLVNYGKAQGGGQRSAVFSCDDEVEFCNLARPVHIPVCGGSDFQIAPLDNMDDSRTADVSAVRCDHIGV